MACVPGEPIMSDFDPTTLATQLAGYDILALQNSITKQTSTLQAQTKALDSLRTALTTFRTSITALNSSSASVLKNVATLNQEGIATVTASASARKGTYSLNVTQLATAQTECSRSGTQPLSAMMADSPATSVTTTAQHGAGIQSWAWRTSHSETFLGSSVSLDSRTDSTMASR